MRGDAAAHKASALAKSTLLMILPPNAPKPLVFTAGPGPNMGPPLARAGPNNVSKPVGENNDFIHVLCTTFCSDLEAELHELAIVVTTI